MALRAGATYGLGLWAARANNSGHSCRILVSSTKPGPILLFFVDLLISAVCTVCCIYIYIHTHMQTVETHTHSVRIYKHACMHTDIQTYRHTDIQTYRHTDIHTHTLYIYICMYIYICINKQTHKLTKKSPSSLASGVEYVTQIARASEEVIAANRAARKVPIETPLEIWCTDVR